MLRHIQLYTTCADIDKKKDGYDLWALLNRCYEKTYNLQNHRNEWVNLKQYALNEHYHTVSLIRVYAQLYGIYALRL